ncbi:glycosyltransferase, partial [Acinetobacter radioresistens]|uniref:glycosyltransferase n=1 Tax=Acinetobacter radioresistens TaxID=40216 RepID=UPI0022450012
MNKRILILVEDYPNDNSAYPMAYVHTRNKLYLEKYKELEIDILSFKAANNYCWEGIKVFSEKNISKNNIKDYSMVVSHAPNIKNHVRFIMKNRIKNIVFFLHGHEVLAVNKYYPKSYSWINKKNNYLRGLYDYFKLKILSSFFVKNKNFKFIFVSKWMYEEALKNLKLKKLDNSFIIHNPVNNLFIRNNFDKNITKKFDFITIRPLDGSKYCIDIVYELAKNNPNYKFKIIGKGNFFKFNKILKNIEWDNNFYTPVELFKFLNEAKAALMPTRLDAQGVMMCELAVYGMPIITSNIEICHEMLDKYNYAYFINNKEPDNDFKKILVKKDLFEVD